MQNAYPYMKYSDAPPAIVVLKNSTSFSDAPISDLEGIFLTDSEILKEKDEGNPLCRRDEVAMFEEKYRGKFIPFNHDLPANKSD